MLSLRDKRYNDVRLIFKEDEHKYTDTLGNEYLSTTTFLHEYQTKFDKTFWLRKKAKELGISEKKLAAQWDAIRDEACDRGSKTHNDLEDGVKLVSKFNDAIRYAQTYDDNSMSTIADLPQIDKHVRELDIKAFIDYTEGKYTDLYNVFDYYTKNGYKIYAEIGAFLIDYLLSGTIDVLCIRDDQFVIGDYKTNRGGLKFESGYFKKDKTQKPAQDTDVWVSKEEWLLPPLNNLPSCNGSIYNMQLSLYAAYVEMILGIPCAGLWLCHIDSDFILNKYGMPKRFPDNSFKVKDNPVEKVTMHKMPYRKAEVMAILEDRRKTLRAQQINTQFSLEL